MNGSGASGVRPVLAAVLTDAFVLLYALWTIACNLTVIAGGTPRALAWAGTSVLGLAAGIAGLAWRRPALRAAYLEDLRDERTWSAPSLGPRTRMLALVGVATPLVTWIATRNPWAVWAEIGAFCLAMVVLAWTRRAPEASLEAIPALTWREHHALALLAVASVVLALFVSRPRSDETFYLHLAVSVIDDADLPLASVNTVHGLPGEHLAPQPMFPPYRVHSYELLVGLLAEVWDVEPAWVSHVGFVALFALLLPLALARVLRILAPERWLFALCVVLAFYCIEGTASRGFGNHAFVRLFSGKSVMLTLGVPLLYTYGLRFGLAPSRWRFAWLAFAQIVAVGLTSTALWLAPVLAGLAVLAATPGVRRAVLTWPLAVASSAYVLVLALWVRAQLGSASVTRLANVSMPDAGQPSTPVDVAGFGLHEWALPIAVGTERTALGLFTAFGVALVLARNAVSLRLLAASSALVVSTLANPWLAAFLASNVTGPVTYQRSFWVLPIPLAIGLGAVAIAGLLEQRLAPRLALVAFVALYASFHLLVTDRLVLSAANGAALQVPPAPKLGGHARAVAESVCRLTRRGSVILATEGMSQQFPIVPGCGAPVLADARWIATSAEDLADRKRLASFVGGATDVPLERARWFLHALERYRVDAVILDNAARRMPRLKQLLLLAGFEKAAEVDWALVLLPESFETIEQDRRAAAAACRFASKGSLVLAPFGVSREIETLGCARPTVRFATGEMPMGAEEDALLQLERVVHVDVKPKLRPHELALLERWLGEPGLSVVVVTRQALGNRALKASLRNHRFERSAVLKSHHVYRRTGP